MIPPGAGRTDASHDTPEARHGQENDLPHHPRRFPRHAKPVTVTIAGEQLHRRRQGIFSTGSLGWYLNGKAEIEVGGVPVQVQIGLNLTIVGSKDLPPDAAARRPRRASDATPSGRGPRRRGPPERIGHPLSHTPRTHP